MADEEQQEENAGGGSKKSRNPKIGKMTLEQVNAALKKAEETMGGFYSAHAKALLDRKEQLS